ncbi:MAG: hypothetical protein KGL11_01515 [Alphaproteobacteria bacterium]|nr:hypothetical protein [Alphaproteobacteria bacterium]
MTRKPLVLAGLCVALLAAPAFAQQSSPGGAMPPSSTMPTGVQSGGSAGPATGMTKPSPTKPKTTTARHKTRHVAQAERQSCWDLAWQSQAMKNCFALHPEQAAQHPQAAQMTNQPSGTQGGYR